MQLILRTAFALFVMTLLPVVAHAGDPSDSSGAESKAITGDEGKNNPNAPGGGTSDAASASKENKAISGDENKNNANKPGGGTSDAQSPGAENKAIQGGN